MVQGNHRENKDRIVKKKTGKKKVVKKKAMGC